MGNTHITELDQSQLAQLRDAGVGRLTLQEELAQSHLLAPEQGTHRGSPGGIWECKGAIITKL